MRKTASLLTGVRRLSSRQAVIFASITATLGAVVVWTVFASSTPNAFEAESGLLAGSAHLVSPTGASGNSAVQFAAATTPTPTPMPTAWPNATNTGYKHAPDYQGSLTAWSGGAIQSNHTYNFIDFNGGLDVGSISAPVSNVSFHGCRFHGVSVGGQLVGLWGDNLTFDYSSFEPGVGAPPVPYNQSYQYGLDADGSYGTHVGQLTVTNSDFWGFGNAIDTTGSTQAKPQVFRGNWIHDASADNNATYHTDGIGTESGSGTGSYVVLDHNTIISAGNTNGIAFQAGHYNHFTITNNLLGGFGYTVALLGGATYTTFTDNTFTTQLSLTFGPLYGDNFWTTTGSSWRRNKWMVPAGAAWGNPAHNGWFWLPNTDSSGTASDDPWVSQTDFTG